MSNPDAILEQVGKEFFPTLKSDIDKQIQTVNEKKETKPTQPTDLKKPEPKPVPKVHIATPQEVEVDEEKSGKLRLVFITLLVVVIAYILKQYVLG
jgi:hypothetical protein